MATYILNKGPKQIPETSFLKKLFCKHEETMSGEVCSSIGLVMISGEHRITVCKECGKILKDTTEMYPY